MSKAHRIAWRITQPLPGNGELALYNLVEGIAVSPAHDFVD
jgi:hypothetical protein